MFLIVPVISHSPTVHHCEEPGSTSLITSYWILAGCYYFPPKMSLLQAEEATSYGENAPALSLLGGFLYSLQFIEICLILGGQKLRVAFGWGLNDELQLHFL